MADGEGGGNIRQVARMLTVPEARVKFLAREGWIPQPKDGDYDVVSSIQGYIKYLTRVDPDEQRLTRAKAALAELKISEMKGDWFHEEPDADEEASHRAKRIAHYFRRDDAAVHLLFAWGDVEDRSRAAENLCLVAEEWAEAAGVEVFHVMRVGPTLLKIEAVFPVDGANHTFEALRDLVAARSHRGAR